MRALGWILLGCAVGCGSDADISGTYSVSLTNRDNGCNLSNFTPGESASNISVVITQNEDAATVRVEGLAALALNALLGSDKNTFTGTVDGDEFSATSIGTLPRTTGNCTYTFNAEITGSIDGDVITGRIDYRAADNGNPDCSQVAGCVSYQDYNGTRPPQ